MRDISLILIFAGILPTIFIHPYTGALAWAWISLMSPHRLAYGFASTLPFAMVVALATIATLPFTSHRKPFPKNTITTLLIFFVGWMSFTTIFALNPDVDGVMQALKQVLKIHLMLLVTLVLVSDLGDCYLYWLLRNKGWFFYGNQRRSVSCVGPTGYVYRREQ